MRKVFKNGNSLAVTVPKAYARELHIRDGSKIDWQRASSGLLLVPQPRHKKAVEIDPQVANLIEKISRKYPQVWQDLARV